MPNRRGRTPGSRNTGGLAASATRRINHTRGEEYVPDFAAELVDSCILFEVKARNELDAPDVLAKAEYERRRARKWFDLLELKA